MVSENRLPEGREVSKKTIKLFSRVASLTAFPAAWRVKMIIGKKMFNGARVIDVGTGPATIPLHLKKFFPHVSFGGLDVSLDMLQEAQKHNQRQRETLHLMGGDGTRLPMKDKSLDGIISFFTLHHVDEPSLFFREIDRVLKDDGFLLIIDFRRDMSRFLFQLMNFAWQTLFFFSSGRTGFKESVESAWRPDEIKDFIRQEELARFSVHTSKTELIIT